MTMIHVDIKERVFHFRQPAGTSRGVYTERQSWLLTFSDGADLSCDALPPS